MTRQDARGAAADAGDLDGLLFVDIAVAAQPYLILMRSASAIGVRRPVAMSLVRLIPPMGITLVCTTAPST